MAELEWEAGENSELLTAMPEEEEDGVDSANRPVSMNLERLAPLSTLSEFKLDDLIDLDA